MKVHVLVTADDPDFMRASTLFTETVRVGFPNAHLTVYDNASAVKGWYGRLKTVNDDLVVLDRRVHHADWIRDIVDTATEKTVIIDPDTMFWRDCEWFHFPVWAGYHIPAMWNEWAGCPSCARVHTSFLWIESPEKLRIGLRNAYPLANARKSDYRGFDPFHPTVVFSDGMPVFYDTCANLYQAIGADHFGAEHLACYDHVNSVGFRDEFLPLMENWVEFDKLHHIAETCPEKLKGLHMQIEQYYERCVRRLQDYVR